ncbi:hypothetical protein D9V37_07435 [Nocardioides mangrovicus]|uniref:Uncharacterized protein n=1 Tax=Nocardioides mangrovicus TaxID=2478913 RepID=A0A3L8P2U0_9ACTN|nr:hypothetical protein [Nocardioides mangrovicus]RLV49736.1 hypothetical protein D9V37_07435 [Nocardioides mangrovicus]
MKVSSPIGELPFEATAIRIVAGGLRVEGRMGAWPAQVDLDISDLPALLRLTRPALYALGGTTLIVALARRPRAHRKA